MTVINTNIKALFTQGALKVSQRESKIAMEQLSTGKRINSAKDDAAGLAIAARMTQNIQSLNQSVLVGNRDVLQMSCRDSAKHPSPHEGSEGSPEVSPVRQYLRNAHHSSVRYLC